MAHEMNEGHIELAEAHEQRRRHSEIIDEKETPKV
jgi:hypothetical protein